jgi:hypothetical protein
MATYAHLLNVEGVDAGCQGLVLSCLSVSLCRFVCLFFVYAFVYVFLFVYIVVLSLVSPLLCFIYLCRVSCVVSCGITEEMVQMAELVVKKKAAAPSTIVKLNIGGMCFDVLRTTLTSQKDSMLEAMFSGCHHTVDKDDNGRYFIDRDGDMFKYVLCFLRAPHVFTLEGLSRRDTLRVREEFEYFQLPTVYHSARLPPSDIMSTHKQMLRLHIQHENYRRCETTSTSTSYVHPSGQAKVTSSTSTSTFFMDPLMSSGGHRCVYIHVPPSTINDDEPPFHTCKWIDNHEFLGLEQLRGLGKYYGVSVDEDTLSSHALEEGKKIEEAYRIALLFDLFGYRYVPPKTV